MIKQLSREDIANMQERVRARLINSLSGFKSANLVGTQDTQGNPNLAIVSSVFHIGANPPLIGMIIRPDTVPRDTLSNLRATGHYTLNHVNSTIWQQAHQTSARYAPGVSEFSEVGLDMQQVDGITAPYVAQSQLKFALALREVQKLEINGTILVIGEIIDIQLPQDSIKADGYIDIESLNTVAISGLDSYHETRRLGRLSYAKPEHPPRQLNLNGEQITERE
ncbi:flavin oxidoreductase [Pseudoalteromonas rubra]|uniref:Flavin oxidoreductase n=1 Tax=Pseudoalteromonas rubra TaxID=43658 RepID=A0A5S3UY80_9GAMM|nr:MULTISPECIES: flavin reductase family protein [Pseudoalteromonas]QPB83190.1 flavin oxidoreductase [Pseudoalteromonas rubra]